MRGHGSFGTSDAGPVRDAHLISLVMPRPVIQHELVEGRSIVIVDFRNLKGDDLLAGFDALESYASTCPENSILVLTLANGIEYTQASMKAALRMVRRNGPHTRKSAIVGLEHLSGLINIINRLTGRSMRTFNDKQSAMEWLLQDERVT